ncbi:hypothetical protein DFS33DRAFT_1388621 [Desarmillaria ectypa]|nr:hypothetical protein DFS33DRAFT_1388621 [Desarmillaria ectypa]
MFFLSFPNKVIVLILGFIVVLLVAAVTYLFQNVQEPRGVQTARSRDPSSYGAEDDIYGS